MKEFNSWSEEQQYECLKLNTRKKVHLLKGPVGVHDISKDERVSFVVNSHIFENLSDFINEINISPCENLYFYSNNHYKKMNLSANEILLLTPPADMTENKVRFCLI